MNKKENQRDWYNDESNWKFGVFYCNRKDKRLFIPKASKQLGWTINLANPAAIILLIVLIGAIVLANS